MTPQPNSESPAVKSKPRPLTGEKRETRQPLNIDRLPVETREEIQTLRAKGKTWEEIEEMSAKFVKWEELPPDVAVLFDRRRLPKTTLHRWYDLRVEQVHQETMVRAESARRFAEAFASRGF